MTTFTAKFLDREWQVPVESGRYHLIVSEHCPFAHRTLIAREVLGLEQHITVDYTSPYRREQGLTFENKKDKRDDFFHQKDLKSIYRLFSSDYEGPYTIPILVDKKEKQIVSVESGDILHLFATAFKPLHKKSAPNLYQEALAQEIDSANQQVIEELMHPIFAVGKAKTQESYQKAMQVLFDHFETYDHFFAKSDYLLGNQLTEADILLFTPLVRFDAVYHDLYSANYRQVSDYPHLWSYLKKLYQTDGFGTTTNWQAIMIGNYTSQLGRKLHKRSIIPAIPDISKWTK